MKASLELSTPQAPQIHAGPSDQPSQSRKPVPGTAVPSAGDRFAGAACTGDAQFPIHGGDLGTNPWHFVEGRGKQEDVFAPACEYMNSRACISKRVKTGSYGVKKPYILQVCGPVKGHGT